MLLSEEELSAMLLPSRAMTGKRRALLVRGKVDVTWRSMQIARRWLRTRPDRASRRHACKETGKQAAELCVADKAD